MPSQADALAWVRNKHWPTTPEARALKMAEEAGEVCGAVTKIPEGRKTIDDLRMELAQLVLCAMTVAEASMIDLWDAVAEEWARTGGI